MFFKSRSKIIQQEHQMTTFLLSLSLLQNIKVIILEITTFYDELIHITNLQVVILAYL